MKDFNAVLNWSKDKAFCSANGWDEDRSPEDLVNWWAKCVHTKIANFIRMGIELDSQIIGYADLASIKNNSAELGIAIGESAMWGKGIGLNSALCMMEYGFKELGIHTFYAETHLSNTRSRKMLERIGFEEVSRIGKEVYLDKIDQLIQYQFKVQNMQTTHGPGLR